MKKFRIFYLFAIIYRILLDAIYLKCIAPHFDYDGLIRNVDARDYFLSWVLFLMFTWMISPFLKRENKLTSNLLTLLYLIKIIPLTSYIACNAQPLHFILLQTIFFSLILLLCKLLPPINIISVKKQESFINIITFIFISVIVFLSGYYTHFRLHFSLTDVYDLRLEARSYNIPIIFEYIHGAAVKVLPLLLIYYIEKKDKITSAIIILVLLLSFGIDGMKSTFFNLILCLCFYFMHLKHILRLLPLAAAVLCFLAYGEYAVNHSYFIASMFIRRVLFIPAHLDTLYYQYTLDFGPIYFNSLVEGVDISHVIGGLWRTTETRANNGLFSDAFINLGTIGVIIYPLLYALFFKWADNIFSGRDEGIVFYASFIMVYNLVGSFFSVCLLTHGMFILCLTVMFMPPIMTSKKIKPL